ncbi:hypothetical protein [Pontibacter akesuensis]|uniref:Lipoprotein n=1 Tax=Pontibacter akesuensis TaxID=388950 RepID=A0A1I7IK41_9BACT|nr:hypothetical protein [Pontibacter akesuensis]SFU73300.1 hypothetical protein SAMN04487941_2272 [Pontibacter akesuensis]
MKIKKQLYLIISASLLLFGCDLNYVDYIEHIESPDGLYNYCLYEDALGISDPGFSVLKIEKNVDPETIYINWSFENGVSEEDREWMLSREILANYEESSSYASDPKIDLIDNRFLVFSRGGYMFGLYDTKLETAIINDCCPFGRWASQNIWSEKGNRQYKPVKKDQKSDYGLWVEENIQNKIKSYIRLNKQRTMST